MLDLRRLLRTRSAYAGRFDASGRSLVFVADLGGVPQVWALGNELEGGWPELLVAPPDRAQTIHPGPRPGQLLVGADVGGNEHTQLLYVAESGAAWAGPDATMRSTSFTRAPSRPTVNASATRPTRAPTAGSTSTCAISTPIRRDCVLDA